MENLVVTHKPASNLVTVKTGTRTLGSELLAFFFLLIPFAVANGMVIAKSVSLPLYVAKIVFFVLPVSFLFFQLWKKSLSIKIVSAVLAILAGAETYIAWQFGGVSGSSLFSILLSSDWKESFHYAQERGLWIALWLLLCGCAHLMAAYFARRSQFRAGGFLILCLLCVAAYGCYLGAMSASLYIKEKNANKFPTVSLDINEKLFGVGYLPPVLSTIKDTFPYGVPIRFWMYLQEEKFRRDMAEKIRNFKFGAITPVSHPLRETYVLVLGESARYDRWAVNGYARDTSPNVQMARQRGELVSMGDMVTARSFTMGSIPIYLTGRDTMREGATQKSLISAFKEAGFKTYFLSTQVKKSFLNNVTSLFAEEADVQQYFEADESLGLIYDDVLLTPLKNILSEAAPKKLIVLHTMGSHAIYAARYPGTFEKFRPASAERQLNFSATFDAREEITNAYDNSIRFADHVLGGIMVELASLPGYAAMVYGSDHGETLPEAQCRSIGHGVTNRQTLHVPYFIWTNQTYRQENPSIWQNLLANQHKPSMTTANFATVIDLAGIRYPGFPVENSLLRDYAPKTKRLVTDMQNVEFDLDTAGVRDVACGVLQARE